MTEKFSTGSLVTYRVRDSFVPRTPDQIKAMAAQRGMPESLCPAYAGHRAMVGKAVQSQIGAAKAAGWLVQPLETSKTKVIYTIARIDKDVERERTDYTHDDVLKWSSEGAGGEHIDGDHRVARECDTAYQALRGLVFAGDWTKHIVDYITGPCKGVAFLDSGKMYWIPPQGTTQLRALRGMLDDVGIGLMIGEIEAESMGDVREVARGGLNEQLEALRAEVEAFTGQEPAKVYRHRLDKLRELRATQMAYEEAVGVKFNEVRAIGASIDARVREMLTVTLDTADRPPVAAQVQRFQQLVAGGEQALAQALEGGVLVLDGNADDVALLLAPEPDLSSRLVANPGSCVGHEDESDASEPEATLDAGAEGEGQGAMLALELAQPGPKSDIPATW